MTLFKHLILAVALALIGGSPAAGQQQGVGGGVFPGPITSAQIIATLGYTPLNKAGDTILGDLSLGGTSGAFAKLTWTGAVAKFRLADGSGDANLTAGAGTFSGDVQSGNKFRAGSASQLTLGVDGNATFLNNAGNGFSLLQIGGVTSSFPAFKRSSAQVNVRTADDSADAAITALTFTAGTGGIYVNNAAAGAGTALVALNGNANGDITTISGGRLGFTSNAANANLAPDAYFTRAAANVVKVVNVLAHTAVTVAGLPSAANGVGGIAYVTDATATTRLSTVAGGGANKVIVYSDGANWLIL